MVEWKKKPKTIAGTALARLSSQVGLGAIGWSVVFGGALVLVWLRSRPKQTYQVDTDTFTEDELEVYEAFKFMKKIPARTTKEVDETRERHQEEIKIM